MEWRVSATFPHTARPQQQPKQQTTKQSKEAPVPTGPPFANGLSFSDDGSLCASSHQDGIIDLYNCETGERESVFHSKQVGCSLIQFTHQPLCVVHAATTRDTRKCGLISYHSLYDNKILRFFKSHDGPPTSISMSPKSDTFLSSAADGRVILWDLRKPMPVGSSKGTSARWYRCCFSKSGNHFATLSNRGSLALFDVRNLSKGCICKTPDIPTQVNHKNCRLTFHNDDPVTATQSNVITMHEKTDLSKKASTYIPHEEITSNISTGVGELVAGCRSGSVWGCDLSRSTWTARNIGDRSSGENAEKGENDSKPEIAGHQRMVTAVGVNPTKQLLVSADNIVSFWLPKG